MSELDPHPQLVAGLVMGFAWQGFDEGRIHPVNVDVHFDSLGPTDRR